MVKHLLFVSLLSGLGVALSPLHASAADLLAWQRSARTARVESIRTNRPILLYASSPHCGHCRTMEHRTLADPIVAGIVREQYIPLAVDADKDSQLLDSLKIDGVPTLVVISPRGEVVARVSGFVPPEQLGPRLRAINSGSDVAVPHKP